MQVQLLSYTREPERTVAAAARLCYSPVEPARLWEDMDQERVSGLLQRLVDMGHYSPLEHASFTLGISGVSRALSHQLVRHRIASYSQKSQRYVEESGFSYVIPPSVAADDRARERFQQALQEVEEAYRELLTLVDREDARYLLPNACATQLVASFNARSLHNFFRLRCCQRAQWEIRDLAWRMLDEVRQAAPLLFARAGPSCQVEGVCYEGAMSCGRAPRLEELAARINPPTAGEDEGV